MNKEKWDVACWKDAIFRRRVKWFLGSPNPNPKAGGGAIMQLSI